MTPCQFLLYREEELRDLDREEEEVSKIGHFKNALLFTCLGPLCLDPPPPPPFPCAELLAKAFYCWVQARNEGDVTLLEQMKKGREHHERILKRKTLLSWKVGDSGSYPRDYWVANYIIIFHAGNSQSKTAICQFATS